MQLKHLYNQNLLWWTLDIGWIPRWTCIPWRDFKLSNSNRHASTQITFKNRMYHYLLRNLAPSQGLCNQQNKFWLNYNEISLSQKPLVRSTMRHFSFPGCLWFHRTATCHLNINISSSLWGGHFAWHSTIPQDKLSKKYASYFPSQCLVIGSCM